MPDFNYPAVSGRYKSQILVGLNDSPYQDFHQIAAFGRRDGGAYLHQRNRKGD